MTDDGKEGTDHCAPQGFGRQTWRILAILSTHVQKT